MIDIEKWIHDIAGNLNKGEQQMISVSIGGRIVDITVAVR